MRRARAALLLTLLAFAGCLDRSPQQAAAAPIDASVAGTNYPSVIPPGVSNPSAHEQKGTHAAVVIRVRNLHPTHMAYIENVTLRFSNGSVTYAGARYTVQSGRSIDVAVGVGHFPDHREIHKEVVSATLRYLVPLQGGPDDPGPALRGEVVVRGPAG